MNVLKKQFVKRNYHKETLKITIDMALCSSGCRAYHTA